MDRDVKVYVAGHTGMVGSAICRKLRELGYKDIIGRGHAALDLTDQHQTMEWFDEERPALVFVAAGVVGGILANKTRPAEFLHKNLQIASNVIECAHLFGTKKLLMLGSSCIYPRLCDQPMKEEALLSGPLEDTNRAYAIAKIAAIELCDAYRRQHGANFISVQPSNLYGPGDTYDAESSHVIPALIRRFHHARKKGRGRVTLWGTGAALRELTYVDDVALACVLAMERYSRLGPVNVGSGDELSISDLAAKVANLTGFDGEIGFSGELDGTPRKVTDSTRMRALGWVPEVSLDEGLGLTYSDYLARHG
jgi:GDP-L-fucose synthase